MDGNFPIDSSDLIDNGHEFNTSKCPMDFAEIHKHFHSDHLDLDISENPFKSVNFRDDVSLTLMFQFNLNAKLSINKSAERE